MWVDRAMKDVAASKLLRDNTHLFIVNEDELRRRMRGIMGSFDGAAAAADHAVKFLHAFAVKANPLEAVVRVARDEGFAAETASIGEYMLAERVYGESGADRIVFDSPAKTLEELHHALQRPCYLNVDNFLELDRVVDLSTGAIPGYPAIAVKATVGIRINPQTVVQTKNAALATGGKVSKFGISLNEEGNKERLVKAFLDLHDTVNLKMLHVHSGSQGLSLETMVSGVRAIVEDLANDPRIAQLVEVVDIGGGFPVDFSNDEDTVSVRDYVRELQQSVPSLFAPPHPRTVITEFGRTICAKAGVLVSRVEYVKMSGGFQILTQHVGADLAVRTVWQPDKWPLRVHVYDEHGTRKLRAPGDGTLTNVCGPCCNSGCTIAHAVELPTDVVPLHDMVVVHDVGGYYHSSFCFYNLRQMPACYVYDEATHQLRCVKKKQSVDETIALFLNDASAA